MFCLCFCRRRRDRRCNHLLSHREVHEAHPVLHDLQLREQDHPGPAVAVHQVPLCAAQAGADTGAPATRRGRREVSERRAAAAVPAVVAMVVVVAVVLVYHCVKTCTGRLGDHSSGGGNNCLPHCPEMQGTFGYSCPEM